MGSQERWKERRKTEGERERREGRMTDAELRGGNGKIFLFSGRAGRRLGNGCTGHQNCKGKAVDIGGIELFGKA